MLSSFFVVSFVSYTVCVCVRMCAHFCGEATFTLMQNHRIHLNCNDGTKNLHFGLSATSYESSLQFIGDSCKSPLLFGAHAFYMNKTNCAQSAVGIIKPTGWMTTINQVRLPSRKSMTLDTSQKKKVSSLSFSLFFLFTPLLSSSFYVYSNNTEPKKNAMHSTASNELTEWLRWILILIQSVSHKENSFYFPID